MPRPYSAVLRCWIVPAALLLGCGHEVGGGGDTGTTRSPTRDGGRAARVDGAVSGDAGLYVEAMGGEEICGNELDDDGDGEADEESLCACPPDGSQTCWPGPPGAASQGACESGTQMCGGSGSVMTWGACEGAVLPERELAGNGADDDCDGMVDEAWSICKPSAPQESRPTCSNGKDDDCDGLADCADPDCHTFADCVGRGCQATETHCWRGIDDDCDGAIDCDDPDCAGSPSCVADPPCGGGQAFTYVEQNLEQGEGPAAIRSGNGGPRMPASCQAGDCPPGWVGVDLMGLSAFCIPPPPDCAPDTHATYVAHLMWRCDPPCELIIRYGPKHGGRQVCAGEPTTCAGSQVATFDPATETWACQPMCDGNGSVPIALRGTTVCVPG